MRIRPADIALALLTALIILSPVAWVLGAPLIRVAPTMTFWVVLWLVVAALGRQGTDDDS
jgi:hypothetical protein